MPETLRWWPMAAPGRSTPTAVARELGIAKVIIPFAPGHFSAYGMLFADLRRDFVSTWFTPLADAPFARHGVFSPRWRCGAGGRARGQSVAAIERDARRRHALCRTGARGHRRPAGRTVQDRGPRRHQERFDAVIRALRILGTERKGRDRQPARRHHRPDAKAGFRAVAKGGATARRERSGATGQSISPRTGTVDTPTFDRAALRPATRSRARR